MKVWLPEGETLPTVEEAAALARRIKARNPDAEVWLFGSLARGRGLRWGSDIDLAVVLPDAVIEGRRGRDIAAQLRADAGPREHGLDLVVFRRSWFEALRDDPTALEATVRREGRVLA
jgi:predicted nucleotidyltransferase